MLLGGVKERMMIFRRAFGWEEGGNGRFTASTRDEMDELIFADAAGARSANGRGTWGNIAGQLWILGGGTIAAGASCPAACTSTTYFAH